MAASLGFVRSGRVWGRDSELHAKVEKLGPFLYFITIRKMGFSHFGLKNNCSVIESQKWRRPVSNLVCRNLAGGIPDSICWSAENRCAFYFHASLIHMMKGHSELEKPRSRWEPVFLERYGLVSDRLVFTHLFRCGFSVCMCMLQLLRNAKQKGIKCKAI